MMRAFVFLSLLLLTPSVYSETVDGLDEVDQDSWVEITSELPPEKDIPVPSKLVLTGRGVYQKKTGESLALACYPDSTCGQYRFVSIRQTGEAAWIGDPIHLTVGNPKAEKLEIKKYLIWRKKFKPNFFNTPKGNFITTLGLFGGTPLIAHAIKGTSLATGASVFIVFSPVFITLIVSYIVKGREAHFVSSQTQKSFTVEQGKGAWNWSEDPIPLHRKKFTQLKEIISARIINDNEHHAKLFTLNKKIRKATGVEPIDRLP